MSTLRQIREHYCSELEDQYDHEEVMTIFQVVAQEVLSLSRPRLMLLLDEPCVAKDTECLFSYLSQLKTGMPVQYVLGKAPFFGMDLLVNPDTLIPRPETEELVEHVLEEKHVHSKPYIIDIGTGSGCIALALKANWSDAVVSAIDVSRAALEIARRNAQRLHLDVEFRCMNILEWELVFHNELYDVIVSNPPYVTREEMQAMNTNVLQFEPHSALFVENDAPLLFYDYISSFAQKHLRSGGCLYFEINQYLASEVIDLLKKKGFHDIRVLTDINGVPRHTSCRIV